MMMMMMMNCLPCQCLYVNQKMFLQSAKRPSVASSNVFSSRYSLLSKENTGMSKTTVRIFIPHERGNSTQDFSTSTR